MAWALLAVLAGHNLFHAEKTFIDVPYRDSWQIISSHLSATFPISWILSPHNEHLISTTKLYVWGMYVLNDWNVRIHLFANYFIYTLALSVAFMSLRKSLPARSTWLLIVSFAVCFSDLNWENITWEFQSAFHLFLLFSLLLVLSLSRAVLTWSNVAISIALNLLALCSLSSALASGFAVLLPAVYFHRKESHAKLAVLSVGFILGAIGWFYLCAEGLSSGAKIMPYQLQFWDFLLNLISFGFGFETYSWALGLLCLTFILFPLLLAWVTSKEGDKSLLPTVLMFTFVLATLATIAVGRASNEDLHIWSKGGRYFEIAVLLVPISVTLWLKAIKQSAYVTSFVLLLPSFGFFNNWQFGNYDYIAQQKTRGIECVEKNKDKTQSFKCLEIWGEVMNKQLKVSRELKLSFIKERTDLKEPLR
jgi:hypothetical protein